MAIGQASAIGIVNVVMSKSENFPNFRNLKFAGSLACHKGGPSRGPGGVGGSVAGCAVVVAVAVRRAVTRAEHLTVYQVFLAVQTA